MIVRDEEHNLPRCLESVAGLFDEIVIVDTGSTDRTVEIARSFGARVFDFAWVDDFAAASNAALARATGDYAFWLDADDVVDPPQREKLEALLAVAGRRRGRLRGALHVRSGPGRQRRRDGRGPRPAVSSPRGRPLDLPRHEQILPALRRAEVPGALDRHHGPAHGLYRPGAAGAELQRDSRILEAELAERPDDPFVLFNLGSIALERQDWPCALKHLRHSLAGSAPTDSITRKLFALIARCHQMLGDLPAALSACSEGLSFDPDDAELLFRKAVLHRLAGPARRAEACWRRILTLKRPEQFCSVDQGIYGHLTLRNLAVLAEERGDSAEKRSGSGKWYSTHAPEIPRPWHAGMLRIESKSLPQRSATATHSGLFG